MMERRLLVGMAGIVTAVLCAFTLQAISDARVPLGASMIDGGRG